MAGGAISYMPSFYLLKSLFLRSSFELVKIIPCLPETVVNYYENSLSKNEFILKIYFRKHILSVLIFYT